MANLVGSTLGKYRLVAKLGRGGMAQVYKAYQPGMNRYVAIKVIHSAMADDPKFIGRFEREALAVGQLRHPNIVQAFDFDCEGDTYYMALEFIDGPTLKEEMEARCALNRPFSLKEVARIFIALCSAIDYAHARGMVHRDLKPANVMINEQGQIVLTDFGITRIAGATQYTQTGALSGTPTYMSPEQGQGQHGDARSDIYSLGIMLYEMVTGVVPYDADTPLAVILKHVNAPLPLPCKIAPQTPAAVEQVILKALSKKPADRYQRAGDMAAALRQAVGLRAEEENLPLTSLTPRPQIQEIDPSPERFRSPSKPVVPPTPTLIPVMPPTATALQPAASSQKMGWLLLLGGSIVALLLLIGLIGSIFLLNRKATPSSTPTPGQVIAAVTPPPAVDLAATATAQAQTQATVTAVAQAAIPTLTAAAVTAQAEATLVQQTAQAQLLAGLLSAQNATATAVALEAATAMAAAQGTAQAVELQAAADRAARQTAEAQVTQTAEALAAQQAAAQATQTAEALAVVQQAAVQATQTAVTLATQAASPAEPTAQTAPQAVTPAPPAAAGTFIDFETALTWKRGDEPNGTLEQSATAAHSGQYAGKLSYNFPSAGNDYVVFARSQPLAGRPNQITAWVKGDGLGHFLNVWVKDNAGEVRQFTFGQVKHVDWQKMTASLDPAQPWPAGHISGPDNNALDYPLSFQALVLDDGSDDFSGSGEIYLDDLAGEEGELLPTPTAMPNAPAAPAVNFQADRTTLNPGGCALLSWNVENVAAVYLNGEGVPGQYSRQVCPGSTTTYTLLVVLRDGSTTQKVVTLTVQ